ncbi:MAG: hypothetical protein AAF242_09085, partial [Bacteroidota bacterium]
LLSEDALQVTLTEIKANRTFKPKMLSGLHKIEGLLDRPVVKHLIYGGDEALNHQGVNVKSWNNV